MSIKEFILTCLIQQRGEDNYRRAQRAFKNCSPEEMQEKYGDTEQTKQEILDGYLTHLNMTRDAVNLVEEKL